MAAFTGRRRPFPALVIVSLLFLFCLYPGQAWMAHFFPRLAGLATIDPGLIILGTPFRIPFSIDLNLLPILFLFLYAIIVIIYSISRHQPIGRNVLQRCAAVISGIFFLVVCTAIGGLISYLLIDLLPARAQNSIAAVGISADIHLPFLGYTTNSLHGNILSLIGFLAGLVLFIVKVTHNPSSRRPTPLTREQRMTPYKKMLQERRRPAPPLSSNEYLHCRNQPLQTLTPEAVNYRPLG